MAIEHWADIVGFEGWYQVSTEGRVRSVDRVIKHKNEKRPRFYKGKILKPKYHNGYAMVNLNNHKQLSVKYIHRLVIETFTLHPRHKLWVNHKNGKKDQPNLANLEWCTPSENNQHAIKMGLRHDNISGLEKYINTKKKRIAANDFKTGKFIHVANCAKDLSKYLIEEGRVIDSDTEVVASAIRYAARSGRIYHNMIFQYV